MNTAYEVIIVNDGSTDNSEDIANNYSRQFPRIKVINQPNMGVSVARNAGIKQARGSYIYFLDPDDYILPGTLDILLDCSRKYALEILTFDSEKTKERIIDKDLDPLSVDCSTEVLDGINYLAEKPFSTECWWYLIDRQFLQESGLFFIEDRWLEDTIFTPELFRRAKRMAYIPLDGHRYVKHGKSVLGTKKPETYEKLLEDFEFAIIAYDEIISSLSHQTDDVRAIRRIQDKQGSLVLFLIIRCIRSELGYNKLKSILKRLRASGSYPIKFLIGKDYNGFIYKLLLKIVNNRFLLKTSFWSYRLIGKYFVN